MLWIAKCIASQFNSHGVAAQRFTLQARDNNVGHGDI